MTVIYIDRVFVLNLAVDYLLLLCTAQLAGVPLRRRRFLLCAVLGAAYAVSVFLPGGRVLSCAPCKIAMGLLLSYLAFRPVPRCWRLMALFFLLSGALAGMLLAVGLAAGDPSVLFRRLYYAQINWPILLLTTVSMVLLLHLVFQQGARHGGGEIMRITVSLHQHKQQLSALHDTGNTLREPATGRPVLVLEQQALLELWPPEIRAILSGHMPPEEKMVRLHQHGVGTDFTLLPFRCVGNASGLLLAVRSDYIQIEGKKYPRTLIALAEGPLSDGGGYCGLWGGMDREGGWHDTSNRSETAALDHQAQQAG